MKLVQFVLFSVCCCVFCFAQVDSVNIDTLTPEETVEINHFSQPPTLIGDKVSEIDSIEQIAYTIVDQSPEFPGGTDSLIKYISSSIIYPENAFSNKIEGVVYVLFVIGIDGSVSSARILRGIGGGCDEEALRVIKAMPRWAPGFNNNKPVPVKLNIPIRFTIQK